MEHSLIFHKYVCVAYGVKLFGNAVKTMLAGLFFLEVSSLTNLKLWCRDAMTAHVVSVQRKTSSSKMATLQERAKT